MSLLGKVFRCSTTLRLCLCSLGCLRWIDLLPVFVVPDPRRRRSVSSPFSRTYPEDIHKLSVRSLRAALVSQRTAQSCHELHTKHNIAVSSTFWELRSPEILTHRRYHLHKTSEQYLMSSESWRAARIAADSTMFRIVNLLIALSFGVHLEQFEQRIGLT